MQFQITEEEQPISQVLEIKVNEQVILGSGGFGMVFEGEWENEKVAVKRIEKRASTTRGEQDEERALIMLDHPNVNKILHVESDNTYK
jgi:serine/threonine protein kinase